MIGETIVVTDNRGFSLVYLVILIGIAAAIAAMLVRIYRNHRTIKFATEGQQRSQYGIKTVTDADLDEIKF